MESDDRAGGKHWGQWVKINTHRVEIHDLRMNGEFTTDQNSSEEQWLTNAADGCAGLILLFTRDY